MSKLIALSFILILFASSVTAQDLSDNDVCMECHADTERAEPRRVHNADGTLVQVDHEMWSCTDCHDYITDIPHDDGVEDSEVDCLNCHDEVPQTD